MHGPQVILGDISELHQWQKSKHGSLPTAHACPASATWHMSIVNESVTPLLVIVSLLLAQDHMAHRPLDKYYSPIATMTRAHGCQPLHPGMWSKSMPTVYK